MSAFVLTLACASSAELTARVDDFIRNDVPILAAPDLMHDLILRDSLGSRGRPFGRYQRWKLNSAGFRSAESVLTPKPGCTRVMTLGSSETFGVAGESPSKEYPAQLADSLARHGCYQVMNAAMVGASLPGITRLWTRWAYRFRPDIVVIMANPMFYLEDSAPGRTVAPGTKDHSGSPWWTPRLISKMHQVIHYPDFVQRRRVQRQLRDLLSGRPDDWFFSSIPRDRLQQYRRDLDSLVVSVRASGGEPVLAAYPMRFGSTLDGQDRDLLAAWRVYSPRALPAVMLAFENAAGVEVRELGRLRDVRVVDLPHIMNGRRAWFDDFVHYSDSGAAVVAGQVGEVVRASTPEAKQ